MVNLSVARSRVASVISFTIATLSVTAVLVAATLFEAHAQSGPAGCPSLVSPPQSTGFSQITFGGSDFVPGLTSVIGIDRTIYASTGKNVVTVELQNSDGESFKSTLNVDSNELEGVNVYAPYIDQQNGPQPGQPIVVRALQTTFNELYVLIVSYIDSAPFMLAIHYLDPASSAAPTVTCSPAIPFSQLGSLMANASNPNTSIAEHSLYNIGIDFRFGLANYIGGLSATAASLSAQVSSLSAQVSTLSNANSVLQTQNSSLSAQVLSQDAQIVALNSQVQSLSAQVTTLQASLLTATQQVNALTASNAGLTAQVSAQNQQIAQLGTIIDGLNVTVANLTAQNNACSALVGTLQAQVTQLGLDVNTLQATVATLTSANAVLTSQLAGVQGELLTCQGTNASNTTQIATLNQQIAGLTGQVSAQGSEINALTAQLSGVQGELLVCQNTNASNVAQITALNQQVVSLTEQVTTQASEISVLNAAKVELEATLAAESQARQVCEIERSSVTGQLQSCQSTSSGISAQNQTLIANLNQAQSALAVALSDNGRLTTEVATISGERQDLQRRVALLNTNMASTKKGMNRIRTFLARGKYSAAKNTARRALADLKAAGL